MWTIKLDGDLATCGDEYRLLELPTDANAEADQRYVFRGTLPDAAGGADATTEGSATLHSATSSYSLREVLTSNTLLLVKKASANPDDSAAVTCDSGSVPESGCVGSCAALLLSTSSYLEPTLCAPDVAALLALLHRIPPYDGSSGQAHETHQDLFVTRDDLRARIQASDAELDALLRDYDAVSIDGYIRPLHIKYLSDVLRIVVRSAAASQSSGLAALNSAAVHAELNDIDVPHAVAEHVLAAYCGDSQEPGCRSLSPERVCRAMAVATFEEQHVEPFTETTLRDFLDAWHACVPEPLEPCIEHLEDISLIRDDFDAGSRSDTRRIMYVPRRNLPATPAARLRLLFKLRDAWPRDALLRRLQELVPGGCMRRAETLALRSGARQLRRPCGALYFVARTDIASMR